MEYNYDEESVKALINWAENAQLPQEVALSEAEHIHGHQDICPR